MPFPPKVKEARNKVKAHLVSENYIAEEVEDALQEACLRLGNLEKPLPNEKAMVQWIYVTAKHCIADFHSTRESQNISLSEFIEVPSSPSVEEMVIDSYHVETILKSLLKKDRELANYLKEGYNNREIAEIIGSNEETVKKQRQRLRPKIEAIFAKLGIHSPNAICKKTKEEKR